MCAYLIEGFHITKRTVNARLIEVSFQLMAGGDNNANAVWGESVSVNIFAISDAKSWTSPLSTEN